MLYGGRSKGPVKRLEYLEKGRLILKILHAETFTRPVSKKGKMIDPVAYIEVMGFFSVYLK
jgi:hypothetical protein